MKNILLILVVFIFAFSVNAQVIPNPDFEIWSTDGPYEIADFWTSSNEFTYQINNTLGFYSSIQNIEGSYSAKLVTTNIGFAGLAYSGWLVNGFPQFDIYTGEVDFFTAGTEFIEKPNLLRGYYIYENNYVTTDSANVIVFLKKFNTITNLSDTIGYGAVKLGPTSGISNFEVLIDDIHPGVLPDSMIIVFSTTDIDQPVSGASLWLDNLSFDNLSSNDEETILPDVIVYPNPTVDKVFVEYDGVDVNLNINIYNFIGELVKLSRINKMDERFEIGVSDLPEGAYLLEINSNGKHLYTKKLLVKRS